MGRARRALAVAALVVGLFVLLALAGCDRRVLVCVSGWMAEDDGITMRLIRRDGTLVPCLTPTGIAPNRSENEANSRGGAEKRGLVLTGFARLDDAGRKKS